MGRFGAAAAIMEQALADDGPTGGVLQALLVTYWHQGRKSEARGLVPQSQELMPGMSARREVSEMALVAPGPRRIVLEVFLATGLPE